MYDELNLSCALSLAFLFGMEIIRYEMEVLVTLRSKTSEYAPNPDPRGSVRNGNQ